MMTEKELGALTSAIYVARLSVSGGSVDSDDKRLRASGLFDDWAPGNHKKGDIYCTHAREELGGEWEQVWRCEQDYDNAKYPDLKPGDSSWFTFNAPLHGTTPETARPWVKPGTGTVGIYHIGECMIWTDGSIRRCLRDTNFSPDEYAADWETVKEAE